MQWRSDNSPFGRKKKRLKLVWEREKKKEKVSNGFFEFCTNINVVDVFVFVSMKSKFFGLV